MSNWPSRDRLIIGIRYPSDRCQMLNAETSFTRFNQSRFPTGKLIALAAVLILAGAYLIVKG